MNHTQVESFTPENKGEEYVAAIDLGTTKIVTIVGRRALGGKVHIVAYSETPSQGIMRGEVLNIGQVVDSIQITLSEVREQFDAEIKDVYVGIAGQHIRCIDSRTDILRSDGDSEISLNEIQEMEDNMYKMRVEPGEKILHVIPQSYNVDEYLGIVDPVGMPGKLLSANYRIFAGKMRSVDYSNRCINRVGLNLKKLVLEPLASAQAVLSEEEKEVGVAMVDIGGGTTDLAIYYDGIVRHSAVIPFGGNIITEDIRKGCGILPRQANSLKIQYGSCYKDLVEDTVIAVRGVNGCESREIPFKFLAEIIEARMDEIIDAIMYEIDRAGYAGNLPAGIVFTGGGAMIQHLKEFVCSKTGIEARVVKPNINITTDSPKEVRKCSYSTAIGLLLKGIEYENNIIMPQITTNESAFIAKSTIEKESVKTVNEIERQKSFPWWGDIFDRKPQKIKEKATKSNHKHDNNEEAIPNKETKKKFNILPQIFNPEQFYPKDNTI